MGQPNLEVFLSQVEDLFKLIDRAIKYLNLTKEGWKVQDLWQIIFVIKKADKGSSVVGIELIKLKISLQMKMFTRK